MTRASASDPLFVFVVAILQVSALSSISSAAPARRPARHLVASRCFAARSPEPSPASPEARSSTSRLGTLGSRRSRSPWRATGPAATARRQVGAGPRTARCDCRRDPSRGLGGSGSTQCSATRSPAPVLVALGRDPLERAAHLSGHQARPGGSSEPRARGASAGGRVPCLSSRTATGATRRAASFRPIRASARLPADPGLALRVGVLGASRSRSSRGSSSGSGRCRCSRASATSTPPRTTSCGRSGSRRRAGRFSTGTAR